MAESIVIVGASLAGLRVAEALRRYGSEAAITVVGEEPHLPYDRPPLSKQVLTGAQPPESTTLAIPDDLGAEWLTGVRAEHVDLDRRVVTTSDEELAFDALVIATGAEPRRLPMLAPGPGVHYLRTLDDSLALAADLRSSRRAVVIGAGFIGLEVASSALRLGVPVTVVEALAAPLERGLGPKVGSLVGEWHRSKGVDLRTGTAVTGVVRGSDGRPEAVTLSPGGTLETDVVVVGIGVTPATAWLAGSGIDLADGVRCDRHLRVLSAGAPVPGVYAVGDVARWWHEGYGAEVRAEHWTNAGEAADAVAANLVAERAGRPLGTYCPQSYVWSDQHGVKLQIVGRIEPGDEPAILEGSFEEERVLIAYGRAGRLVGAFGVRRPARVMALQRLIEQGAAFPPEL